MKVGFVALIGRPNAGKSTLLNQIMKDKISIVSDKAQTTRNSIKAILSTENAQIIFIDTPGIHKPLHELGKQLNKTAVSAMDGVDVVYFLLDATQAFGQGDQFVLDLIKRENIPIFLIFNKIDLLTREQMIVKLTELNKTDLFSEIIPVSAITNDNVETLLKVTLDYLPEGEALYPTDMITEFPEQFFITEIIREQILISTSEEIPHSVAILIDNFKEDKHSILIQASILVERDSQKSIIIGKQGQKIKAIGSGARAILEKRLGKNIYLDLMVKVEKNWRNSTQKLNAINKQNTGSDYNE
ncbi:MAG: GTP-binding protein Era [Erysipelotrichaceae bacterium]|nr:MAG: GTP-binding protein [Erysipelotrichaceae bacterium]TXT17348.1 MAG: GTP-binding protein Era [Erysipelotrichaceae bacterium]